MNGPRKEDKMSLSTFFISGKDSLKNKAKSIFYFR